MRQRTSRDSHGLAFGPRADEQEGQPQLGDERFK